MEIFLDPSFTLMTSVIQYAEPWRYSSHHAGIAKVYIFPSAVVINAAANTVAEIYIEISANAMPQ